jgi:hypothetical protein
MRKVTGCWELYRNNRTGLSRQQDVTDGSAPAPHPDEVLIGRGIMVARAGGKGTELLLYGLCAPEWPITEIAD